MADIVIIGCGRLGRDLAAGYVFAMDRVRGLVRNTASAQRVATLGAEALVADLDHPETLSGLSADGSLLFHLVPPAGGGDTDGRTANLLAWFERGGHPRRIVYAGTSGVYGDCGGAWIDETEAPNPQAARAKRRLDAERQLVHWMETGCGELVRLRIAGIYGPGRLPEERLRSGEPVLREDQAPYSNRIHSQDLVSVCMAAMDRGEPGGIYNVSDGHPSTMTDYFYRVADHLGIPRPPALSLDEAARRLSPGMLSYLRESRRLSNRKMIRDLGVRLLYPDLTAGLAAMI